MQLSENPPQSYNILQDKTMDHPSLYYSSHQVPYSDTMNSENHPGTRSIPHRQRDRFSSVARGLNDFQTVHNMSNYLSPGPESFYNTPAQLDNHVMGTQKKWSRSPVNLNVSRTSTTTSLFRYRNVPLEAESSVIDPLPDVLTNDQGLGLRKQLEAYIHGYHPSGFQPQGIAHGRNVPTDAPPSNQVAPQGPGNAQHIDSRPTYYSGDNVRPAAHPRQAYSTSFDFNYAAPPQMYDPSYISTPVAVSPRIKSEHCEPSGVVADSGIFTTCSPTLNVTRDIKPESLDTCPSHHSRDVSELNDSELPTTTPIPRPQRRRRRRRRIPTANRSKAVSSSNSATSPRSSPPPSVAGSLDSSTTLTPDHGIEYDFNLKYPQPSNNSVEVEVDPDEIFREFTTLHDNVYLGGGCQMVDLGAPDVPTVKKEHESNTSEPNTAQHSASQPVGDAVKKEHVPNTSEPNTTQHSASQPVEDASSEKTAMPQQKKRKRSTSDAITPEPDRHQQAQKPRKKKMNRSSTPRTLSDDPRRINPNFLYFCADSKCYASLNVRYGFGGFKTKEDAQRHLLVHSPARFICSLPHRSGKEYCGKRADNFRE